MRLQVVQQIFVAHGRLGHPLLEGREVFLVLAQGEAQRVIDDSDTDRCVTAALTRSAR
jgi:hypothetical protein